MISYKFELKVMPRVLKRPGALEWDYGVAIWDGSSRDAGEVEPEGLEDAAAAVSVPEGRSRVKAHPVVRIWGTPFRVVTGQILEAIKRSGHRASDLSRTREAPFALDEREGVRLALLLLAVKPLQKVARIEAVAMGIQQMSLEEVYYWYAKCTADGIGPRAQRALRILLAGE